MKKTYIVPAIKTVCVRTGRMMTGSLDVNVDSTPVNITDQEIGAKEDDDFGW